MRELYREAGVHIYSDSGDVLSANASWLMVHTRTEGTKRIVLPRTCRKVTEVTTEKTVGEQVDHFSVDLPRYATAVFLME